MSRQTQFDDAMLEGLRRVPGGLWRTYIAPQVKVVFESVNKNACTSLKWMMADLAGEELAAFRAGRQPFISDSEAVHNRSLWKASPWLNKLTAEERSEIHPDRGWFIFAVVRDPRLRLFSAWQNKILIEGPHSQRWRNEWWYPRHPLTRDSVIEDFEKFVTHLEQEDSPLRNEDPHFRDQVELLAEHAVPYTRIYEIHELGALMSDLHEHLRGQNHVRPLYLPKSNPTPLHPVGDLFADGVRARVEELYAADFDRFGHVWPEFSRVESSPAWTTRDLATCETESALGYRIAQVHQMAREEREKRLAMNEKVQALECELAELRAAARETMAAPTPTAQN